VDWMWRNDCITSSVAKYKSDGFFSCGATWRSTFMQSLPGLSKLLWQDFQAAVITANPNMLRRVRENVKQRTTVCLEMDRGHFEHLL
jgi:hypothetical protein